MAAASPTETSTQLQDNTSRKVRLLRLNQLEWQMTKALCFIQRGA
jgi:hypothetical protein